MSAEANLKIHGVIGNGANRFLESLYVKFRITDCSYSVVG